MRPWIRNHITTIVLSALAAAGAVVVLVVDRGSVTTEEAESRKKNVLEAFRRDDVSEIAITVNEKSARVFRGAPGPNDQRPWEIDINGQRFPADESTVDQLLGTLDLAVFERRVPAGSVDRGALGLDKPRASIALKMGDQSIKLAVGGPAPAPEGAAYAEADGRGVVVITAQLAAALEVDPDRLRTKSIVPYTIAQLETLELSGKGGTRGLERASWGGSHGPGFRWNGRSPEGQARVNGPALDRVIGALGDLEAQAFLPDQEAERALSKEVSITMVSRFADSVNAQIDVGGACPGHEGLVVAVRRSPSLISACVPESVLDGLSTPAEDLVDRRLFAATADAVIEVKLTSGDKTLEIARKGTGWQMRSPSERAVEATLGQGLVESLLKIEAIRVVGGAWPGGGSPPDLAALGLDKPRATVRLTSSTEASSLDGGVQEERVELIEIGAREGDIVHIRRVEDGALLELAADAAPSLFPSEASLRSLTVLNEPAKRFRSISVRAGDRVQRIRRGEEGWELIDPRGAGLAADTSFADELAERLGSLTASRWAPAKDDASYGLDQPRIAIDATLGDEDDDDTAAGADAGGSPKEIKILLGAPATEGSFAKLAGDNAVFVAPKELERAAARWLIDREALRVDPASIAKITISAEKGSKVEIARSGDVWSIRSGGGGAARAAAVRDALADLIAEEAVSVGKPTAHEGLEKPTLTLDIERAPAAGAPASEAAPKPVRIVIGAGDVLGGTQVYYARRSGVDATFAVARSRVTPLLDAARAP